MRRCVWVLLGCLVLGFFGAGKLSAEEIRKTLEHRDTQALRQDIQVLNLVNGLELTKEQMEIILACAEESLKMGESLRLLILSRKQETQDALERIRTYLMEGKEIPEDLARSYHLASTEAKKALLLWKERRKELARRVEENLDSHQIYGLEKYVPCIIPPKGELRIGQALDPRGLVRNLERIRQLPARAYARGRDILCRRALEGIKRHTPLRLELDEEETLRRLGEIMDEARGLDPVEFEVKKDSLAEDLAALIPTLPATSGDVRRKIESFLLAPQIIPILRQRLHSDGE